MKRNKSPIPPPDRPALDLPDLVWSGPLVDPSGYGEESRELLLAADAADVRAIAHIIPWSADVADIHSCDATRLTELGERAAKPGFVHVVHNFAPGFFRYPQAGIAIGRTLFETDRLPDSWVAACERMDYLWCASEFNRQSFLAAGVPAEKLAVIPECLDPVPYIAVTEPSELALQLRDKETRRGGEWESTCATGSSSTRTSPFLLVSPSTVRFLLLSVFDWTLHKGWDALLRGFLAAFQGRDDVRLVFKVWSTMGYTPDQIVQQAADFCREALGHDLFSDLRIVFCFERLTRSELLGLYRGCDACVLPSRGEGWGRPYMEAMAMGIPVLATNWGGNTEYMTPENSFLVEADVVDVPERGWREIVTYKGHRWAEPRRESLVEQLRRIVDDRPEAMRRAKAGQETVVTRYSREAVGALIRQELERIQTGRQGEREKGGISRSQSLPVPPSPSPSFRLRWEGSQFNWHSLGLVNREICLALLQSGRVDMALWPFEGPEFAADQVPRYLPLAERVFAPLSGRADVHVRHFFPPRFERPDEGKLVLIQPWEYGSLPHRWVEPIRQNVDEVWCYSQYVREVYRASGVPVEKLQVIPLGVDPSTFNRTAAPYVFTDEPGAETSGLRFLAGEPVRDPFVFLFVGGTQHRKGTDILLEAYRRAFSTYDDVCLVIKDTGTKTVYRYGNEKEKILGILTETYHAPMIYFDDDLSPRRMAGLYRRAHCLVQPYRGEGFCLPAIEAMACGTPAIVPAGGPTDDFIDETVGWRMPAERKPHGNGRIGEWDCVGETWMLEVSVDTLARTMRAVYADRVGVKRRGEAAAARAHSGWTWQHTAEAILKRLEALAEPVPVASPTLRPAAHMTRDAARAVEQDGHPSPTTGKARGRGKQRDEQSKVAPAPLPEKPKTAGVEERTVVSDRRAASRAHLRLESVDEPSSNGAHTRRTPPRRRPETLSLCMIVKNEERVLGDCLASIKPHVDEMIVVDTGSTDRTVEIAERAGAKVLHSPWQDSFSQARNVSLEHATCDWVYWMDADDTIPEACGRMLREVIRLAEDRVTGYMMQVHIPPKEGDHGFTIVDHVKIFRNDPRLRFEGRIHEQILEPIYRIGGTIERTNLYVVHSGYDYSPEGQQRKRERDLKLLSLDAQERPEHPFVHFNIGMTLYHLKDHARAVEALERSLALSKRWESTVRKIYAMLAGCHMELRDWVATRTRIEEGLALYPRDPELLFRAGIFFKEMGDLPRAEHYYRLLLTEPEAGHIDSLDVTMMSYKARHNLALIYQEMGRLDDAHREWQAALQAHPTFAPSLMGLGELYLRMGRAHDARMVVQRLAEVSPEDAASLQQRLIQNAGH
jgi:glycosyltransferase involved in cell wall biosynthesis